MGTIVGYLVGIMLGIGLGVTSVMMFDLYKDGQIDALSGDIRYELVVHPDSTRTWEKKK